MPRRKSAASLKELCMGILHRNVYTLPHEVRNLPKPLINELYDKCCKHYEKFYWGPYELPPRLPAEFFFMSGTKRIYSLDYFDRPPNEIVDKINRYCKKIRILYLRGEEHIDFDYITPIVIHNPRIFQIDLTRSKCTNHHLSIIGKHCPQLRGLKLFQCDLITNEGINFLPEKLEFLYLPEQITLTGHLNALENLPCLKNLHGIGDEWDDIIVTCAESLANGVGKRTYQIEEMRINFHLPRIYNNVQTVVTMFPKLCKLTSMEMTSNNRIAVFLEAINHNLLTSIRVNETTNFIRIAAHLCPMLETLEVYIDVGDQSIDDRYLAEPKHVPFQHLCELSINDVEFQLSWDDLKFILANCQKLDYFALSNFRQLSDQLIYDILAVNPLKCVNYVYLEACETFSVEGVVTLLKSLDSLTHIDVFLCSQISLEDQDTISGLIRQMNWDIKLIWDLWDRNKPEKV